MGSWRIPRSQWTMFWTTEGVGDFGSGSGGGGNGNGLFADYEAVCKGVEPSWMDCGGVVD